jgi:hypothetical protein
MTLPELRAWLLSGRDPLLGRLNSLLLFRQLRARRQFESAGYSGHIVRDLKTVSFGLGREKGGQEGVPASSRSGDVK